MHRIPRMHTDQQNRTSGFTLIELLVVISIIALLSAMLLGGIQAARLSMSNAQAGNELNSMSTALAQFHSEFGMYPPSNITLYEEAAGWAGDIRSTSLMRKLWPSFNFGLDRDINGDSTIGGQYDLDGRECLVFFTGGMMKGGAPIGFSQNPSNPFRTAGNNRTGPFHEFIVNRLVDTDGDGAMEYLDTYSGQSTPILYLSSYDGRGYRAADVTPFLSAGVYLQGSATGSAWKSKTYQLISPGQDTIYGTGGHYDPDSNGGIGQDDWDNLTNFSSGKLK